MEILSDATRRRDLADKLPVYLLVGVLEVVIVDLVAQTVAVYMPASSPMRSRVPLSGLDTALTTGVLLWTLASSPLSSLPAWASS